MTVSEIRKVLESLPPDLEVFAHFDGEVRMMIDFVYVAIPDSDTKIVFDYEGERVVLGSTIEDFRKSDFPVAYNGEVKSIKEFEEYDYTSGEDLLNWLNKDNENQIQGLRQETKTSNS